MSSTMTSAEAVTMGEGTELERKLDVDPGFVLPDFAALGYDVDDQGDREMTAVYWDTTDLRLARARYGIRHRSESGWTVKGPSRNHASGFLERSEAVFDGDAAYPPPPVLIKARNVAGDVQLQPVIELQTARHTVVVRRDDDVAEVVHDRVIVMSNGEVHPTFCEVEIEVKSGGMELSETLAGQLIAAGARPSEHASKYIRGLQLAGRWR